MKNPNEKYSNLTAAVPDHWPFHEQLTARLAERKEKRSEYILALVAQDLSGGPPPNPVSPRIMVDLTRELCGRPAAAEMEQLLGDQNQPNELTLILQLYISARKGGPTAITPEVLARFDLLLKEWKGLLKAPPAKPQGLRGSQQK